MRILFVASNPPDQDPLETEREVSALQRRLDRTRATDAPELRTYPELLVDDLEEVIARTQPDILHFSAHGTSEGIVLKAGEQARVHLTGADLADLLQAIGVRPKLVVVNACNSATMALEVSRAADFAIGTDAPITNGAARCMAATLYGRLSDSASIDAAFRAAQSMLRIASDGQVDAHLFPDSDRDRVAADRVRLTEPLRILASLPVVETWLEKGLTEPGRGFEEQAFAVQFGVAGAPASTTQLQFFTDDEGIVPAKGQSVEEARSWLLESRAVRGEIWIRPYYAYGRDMQWFASAATSDRRIVSAAANTCEALERYYFAERWKGDLPDWVAAVVRETVAQLRRRDGARRPVETVPGRTGTVSVASDTPALM